MKNIDRWIYSTLTGDSTLVSLLDGDEDDPRIYTAYPPKSISLSEDGSDAYIIYMLIASGEIGLDAVFRMQRPDEVYQISIFSKSKNRRDNVFERVDALLNRIHDADITGWIVRWIRRVGQREIYEVDDHIYHKALDYRMEGIWEKVS